MITADPPLAFVHIPKTGGTSLEIALTGFDWITADAEDYAIYLEEQPRYTPSWGGRLCSQNPRYFDERMAIKHATQAELREALGEDWPLLFKFTFVRNPWARVFSMHQHGLRDAPGRTPPTLDAWLAQPEPADHMKMPLFRRWIDDWAELGFVGRFETLEEDFSRLLVALDLPPAPLPHVRHGSKGTRDASAWTDRAIERVARESAEEIDRFGYTFAQAFRGEE